MDKIEYRAVKKFFVKDSVQRLCTLLADDVRLFRICV